MNKEIESKFKINDFGEMREKVIKLGAESESVSNSEDIYFKIPQKVASTKYLRVRTKNKKPNGTLAYHEVQSDIETKEWETDISDVKITKELILKLGFLIDVVVKKERETFKICDVEIVLDKVEDLGNFIEIEAPDKGTLNDYVKKLEISKENIVSGLGYPDLLKQKYESNNK
jgi:adenylate cyclase class 2